jgi:hypothetical protein
MDINEIKSGSAMNALVAEALGWQAFTEKRGEWCLAVTQKPGDREPWKNFRYESQEKNKERYEKISCFEAAKLGFYGNGFPDYSESLAVAMEIPRKMRQLGKDLDFCRELSKYLTIENNMTLPGEVLWNAFYGLDKLEVLFCRVVLKIMGTNC